MNNKAVKVTPEVKEELRKLMAGNWKEVCEGSARSEILNNLSERYDIKVSTLNNHYYTERALFDKDKESLERYKELHKQDTFDEGGSEEEQNPFQSEDEEVGRPERDNTFNAKVCQVHRKYATVKEVGVPNGRFGILHVSNISTLFVENATRWLKQDDVIRVYQLPQTEEQKVGNKFSFAMKDEHFQLLTDYSLADQFERDRMGVGAVHKREDSQPAKQEVKPPDKGEEKMEATDNATYVKEEDSGVWKPVVDEVAVAKDDVDEDHNKTVEYISNLIASRIGAVSPKAKMAVSDAIKSGVGTVEFAIALTQVLPSFDPDLSALLVKEVVSRMGDCFR